MTATAHTWSALPVPYAIDVVDRVRKERYFDPEFFAMEAELLWPKVWQMACRLEEIPEVGDFAEYEILDQSVLVVRTEHGICACRTPAGTAACGSLMGAGSRAGRIRLLLPRLVLRPGRHEHEGDTGGAFSEHNLDPSDLDLDSRAM